MVDEELEAELMFVSLLCSIAVLDEDESLNKFRITLLSTIHLPQLELVCMLSYVRDVNKYNK